MPGARIGELLGLRWQDIDLDGGFVRVRGQLDRSRKLVDPKTPTSHREIVLMPSLARTLRRHKETAFAFGRARPTDLVFTTGVGTPHSHRNVGRALAETVQRAGLDEDGRPSITMHTFRDTFASQAGRLRALEGAFPLVPGQCGAVLVVGLLANSVSAAPSHPWSCCHDTVLG